MSIYEKNLYAPIHLIPEANRRSFDEGPTVFKKPIVINSSSISTREVDQYRQGVELTLFKHNNGLIKISAGTPSHIVQPLNYRATNFDSITIDSYYKEIEVFDPIRYIAAQESGNLPFTFPIITGDTNQAENYDFNGIIEPLTIRPVASFYSIEFPFESHAIRGTMMGGNSDVMYGSSDQVLTVDYYPTRLIPAKTDAGGSPSTRGFLNEDWYLDSFESFTTGSGEIQRQIGFIDSRLNSVESFFDTKVYLESLGITVASHGQDMVEVFRVMTGSSDNYIPPGKKSGVAGLVYDNLGYAGTDSVAFGGLTY
jgi:hypothetical protein